MIKQIVFATLILLVAPNARAQESDLGNTKMERVNALLRENQLNGHAPVAKIEQEGAHFSIINMLGGLFLCLGVFGAGVHFYSKRCLGGPTHTARHMRVIEKLAITPKCALVYFEVQGQRMLATVGSEHANIQQLDFGLRNYEECLTESRELQA